MSRERCLLDSLLEPGALSMVFQPIFECRGESRTLHALECLVRGPRGVAPGTPRPHQPAAMLRN